jgi:CheY-like chemotaxis protein
MAMQKVLVIEDDAILAQLIKIALKTADLEAVTAEDGQIGIKALQQGEFIAVVTDIVMPEMDGNQVADYIRHSPFADLPIIAVTGTIERVEKPLFDLVLKKPFELKTLITAVAGYAAGASSPPAPSA